MEYEPKVGDRVRATSTNVSVLPAEAFRPEGVQDVVEGEVISVDESAGTIVVRNADGDLVECYAAAFPL